MHAVACSGIEALIQFFNPYQPYTCVFLFALDTMGGEQMPQSGVEVWCSRFQMQSSAKLVGHLGPDLAKA